MSSSFFISRQQGRISPTADASKYSVIYEQLTIKQFLHSSDVKDLFQALVKFSAQQVNNKLAAKADALPVVKALLSNTKY